MASLTKRWTLIVNSTLLEGERAAKIFCRKTRQKYASLPSFSAVTGDTFWARADIMQAVEWAIEQKVDIISISWITKKDVKLLRTAVKNAVKDSADPKTGPILVFCATANEGVYASKGLPRRISRHC